MNKIYKLFNRSRFLCALLVVCFFAVAYFLLTRGRTMVHSDCAIAIRFAESIKSNRCLYPESFSFNNSEFYWSITQFFTLITTTVFSDLSMARMVASLLTIIVAGLAITYCSHVIGGEKSFLIAIILIFVYLQNQKNFILYEAGYTSIFIVVIFELALFVSLFKENMNTREYFIRIGLFGLILCILSFNGIRFISEITVPFIFGIILIYIFGYFSDKDNVYSIRKLLINCGVIIVATIIGYGIYKWMCTWHIMNPSDTTTLYFVDSTDELWTNIGKYFSSFFDCFTFEGGVQVFSLQGICNLIGIVMTVLLCFVCPILQGVKIKRESHIFRCFYVLVFSHNLVVFVAQAVSGLIVISIDVRYILTTVVLLVVISSRYIYLYWIKNESFFGNLLISLFVFSSLIMSINLIDGCGSWKVDLENEQNFVNLILQNGLHKGYATYWNAYNQEVYSNGAIEMGAIKFGDEKISVDNSIVDSSTYTDSNEPSFLLVTYDEKEEYGEKIIEILGEPLYRLYEENVFTPYATNTWNNDFYIYVYDHDIIQQIADDFVDNELTTKDMLYNADCTTTDEGIEMKPSGVVRGPCSAIEKGTYTVEFMVDNISETSCFIQSYAHADSLTYTLIDSGDDYMTYEMVIDDYIDDIQFYTVNETSNSILWKKILVNKEK